MARGDRPGDIRWLLLEIRLPRGSSTARVGIWRRLRRLGAVDLGAAWALPDDTENRERGEWLCRDVEAAGGEAMLFAARPVGSRAADALARRHRGEKAASRSGPDRLTRLDPARFRGRTWVTRPRPGVDRMASAWFVRRFVDPRARFAFAADADRLAGRAVPFDTYGADLGHQAGLCTFEVLGRRFGVNDAAVTAIGRIVHAIDLDEMTAGDADAALIARLVEGLRASYAEDGALLAAGMTLFEALYSSYSAAGGDARRARTRARAATKAARQRAGRKGGST